MAFLRGAFIGAFLLLIVVVLFVRSLVTPYFSSAIGGSASPDLAARPTSAPATVGPTTRATALMPTPAPRVIIKVVTATPRPVSRPVSRRGTGRPAHTTQSRPTPTPLLPTATPPLPSPTAGTVQLARYWVDSQSARQGQVVAVGYVIDNSTGRVEDVSLGASLKARGALSWGSAINDPAHDVVAIVPPGISTHLRYFRLPPGLHPGDYDVAWGLRDAHSGRRVGLVFAPDVLTVLR